MPLMDSEMSLVKEERPPQLVAMVTPKQDQFAPEYQSQEAEQSNTNVAMGPVVMELDISLLP
jgi:hypothetical protein